MNIDGSYSNEWEAAYALSQRTQEYPRQTARVTEAVNNGLFVVVLEYPVYCVHTDAFLAMATVVCDTFTTREAADQFVASLGYDPASDSTYYVLPKLPMIPNAPEGDDYNDLPF